MEPCFVYPVKVYNGAGELMRTSVTPIVLTVATGLARSGRDNASVKLTANGSGREMIKKQRGEQKLLLKIARRARKIS